MASTTPTLQSNSDTSPQSQRKKRRKTHHRHQTCPITTQRGNHTPNRWTTQRQQQIYSSNLLDALRRASRTNSLPPPSQRSSAGSRGIREVADRVLATSARGTTRWSRAILASRLRARLRKHKRAKVPDGGKLRKLESGRAKPRRPPAVDDRVRVLSRLVPGCRKLPFSNLLEEATDYIAALEMQVRAMTALTEILTGSPPTPV